MRQQLCSNKVYDDVLLQLSAFKADSFISYTKESA